MWGRLWSGGLCTVDHERVCKFENAEFIHFASVDDLSKPDIVYEIWSGRWDSNPQLPAWEAGTLPLSYAR